MATMIRRPTGDGDKVADTDPWVYSSGSTAWNLVDEEVADDDDYTYLGFNTDSSNSGYLYFTFNPFSLSSGSVVNKLRIHFRTRGTDVYGSPKYHRAAIKVNGTRYPIGTEISTQDSDPVDRYYDFATNPATGSAWTVADINGSGAAPLQQFGIGGVEVDRFGAVLLYKCYAEIDYTPGSDWVPPVIWL